MRVEQDVMAVLSAATFEGSALRLTGQLDRNLYVRANKVLEAAGGKWNRKAKAHLFDADAEERVGQIILTGSVVVPKDEFDFFETTPDVVDEIMNLAHPFKGMVTLEPSAGRGAIARAAAEFGPVDCIELMEDNVEYLVEDGRYREVIEADFLTVPVSQRYDRVLMNPPFSKRQDIKHVTHALSFLKKDGVLVAVMSAGVLFREDRMGRDFREMVEARGGSFDKLPEGSFKESGTMVNTCILRVEAE